MPQRKKPESELKTCKSVSMSIKDRNLAEAVCVHDDVDFSAKVRSFFEERAKQIAKGLDNETSS